jgi:hypothetical protein
MESEERTFTPAEANQLIPQLEGLLKGIKKNQLCINGLRHEIKKAGDNAMANGGSPCGPRYILTFERIIKSVETIQDMGVVVKDMEQGLCDFPCFFQGRMIYLCWKLGESEVQWWHEINTGFQGRRPIEKGLF